ncbi:4-hydroxyphenylacetate catabolism regulatory protein HpaA [Zoogloea sp.]|uniref:4-hydroxyphenylacetate catabolism regulatory protein HpaA n=1 Tax=Zoogloea sp. TaxID=49181 RepID=UPI001AD48D7F|nr:4-hydroxyphenylacetate catabolism regulatory protein HpaA [Zoogloea sp.]MBN8283539.1 4-hydroxyphenylacetate catabolism regulatory protein HpaA [Zoogloea sp.]
MSAADPADRSVEWPQSIPDIHITRIYEGDPECDVHYETFGRLAEIFGRNTPAHRHSRFYQVHLLVRGSISLQLDDQAYFAEAPLVFITPPAIPHAFYSEENTDGHVITVRQEVVRAWYASLPGQWPDAQLRESAFLPLGGVAAEVQPEVERLMQLAGLLQQEFGGREKGRSAAVRALGLCFFISLNRLLATNIQVMPLKRERGDDLRIFLSFCDLVEAHFRDHLTLPDYAGKLAVTEARLNDVCRRMANLPSKEVVHDRLLQEARRLLRFSTTPVGELSYQLGFADPAYFSRFFTRRVGMAPSQFRIQHQDQIR